MYSLIVVDDENAIRKGICDYIDWNTMGLEVAASFEDGRETLEYLQSHRADVVLTDIEMAEVSGLELARRIYQSGMSTRVVIISGYKEFEYARKAIEYGVEYYLLKPVKLDEVAKVFGGIKTQLDEQREHAKQSVSEQERLETLLPVLREQFWINLLVVGGMTRETLRKRFELLRLDIDADAPCALLNVGFDSSEDNALLAKKVFAGSGTEIDCYEVRLSDETLKLVAVAKNKDMDFECALINVIEEKRSAASGLLKADFSVSIERVFQNIPDMAGYNSFSEKVREKPTQDDPELTDEQLGRLTSAYRTIMETIESGGFEKLEALLSDFIERGDVPFSRARQLCVDTLSVVMNRLMRMQTDARLLLADGSRYEELLRIAEPDALKTRMSILLEQLDNAVREKQNAGTRELIERSAQYMREHCSEDVSLELMADRCYLNPAYFSRLFKQYMGNTFTECLIEYRMEKAKQLLMTGKYKVYEVSRLVGYRSEKYFFRVFRQCVGCSPVEFCRRKQ